MGGKSSYHKYRVHFPTPPSDHPLSGICLAKTTNKNGSPLFSICIDEFFYIFFNHNGYFCTPTIEDFAPSEHVKYYNIRNLYILDPSDKTRKIYAFDDSIIRSNIKRLMEKNKPYDKDNNTNEDFVYKVLFGENRQYIKISDTFLNCCQIL